ncbi:hypothetical protein PHJA_001489700 [Phtheirospermum japonicum]|uniref:Uncharacterized protein n=1 Tax=Phtheirospermum japonicum TaxID=374723 RepID=A0A830CBR8_9LAMI|nr:hypothetical protein PHJA_001489700 [Phtheirospermum japonicum]
MKARAPQPRRRVHQGYRRFCPARRRRGNAALLRIATLTESESFLIHRTWSRCLYATLGEQIELS